MNVASRGIKNALRSPLRSGAIVLMLAISIGLILSMLVARTSINNKIDDIKATTGTTITISPAGVMGFAGGGNALTSTELSTVNSTEHIVSTVASLSDQMSSDDTNLTASLEMGNFGGRQMRFEIDQNSSSTNGSEASSSTETTTATTTARPTMTPRITVTGTADPNSVSTTGENLNIISGESFDGNSSNLVAIIGTDLAEKNSLAVGNTFTAYDNTITIVGIYETGNTYQDSGIIMPIATVQTLTDQADSISSITATVDSSDNVTSTVSAIEASLADKADITSEVEQAESSISSLQSIANLALAGVIGSTVAGAVIVLLAMIIVVRERRREIGVLKAIGGSNLKVVGQFVAESMTLTVVGSIIGLAFGVLACGPITSSLVTNQSTNISSSIIAPSDNANSTNASSSSNTNGFAGARKMMQQGFNQISANLTQITGILTPLAFVSAIGMTFLIAIIGSVVPVLFITRIRPAEVLRSE